MALRIALPQRERLTEPRIYYVRTDGNDANNGRTNTAGGACQTIQKAVDAVAEGLDMGPHQVTIQAGDGTYTAASRIRLKNYEGTLPPILQGNVAAPANCILALTAPLDGAILCADGVRDWIVQGFKFTASAGSAILLNRSTLQLGSVEFGANPGSQHIWLWNHSRLTVTANYTVSGSCNVHATVESGSVIDCLGKTVTLTGNPVFNAFVRCFNNAYADFTGAVFSGAATGPRYGVYNGGVLVSNGGNLPGSAAGTVGTGGQYI